jgi:hypothetical protein
VTHSAHDIHYVRIFFYYNMTTPLRKGTHHNRTLRRVGQLCACAMGIKNPDIVDIVCRVCHAPCTLKISCVDFQKEHRRITAVTKLSILYSSKQNLYTISTMSGFFFIITWQPLFEKEPTIIAHIDVLVSSVLVLWESSPLSSHVITCIWM